MKFSSEQFACYTRYKSCVSVTSFLTIRCKQASRVRPLYQNTCDCTTFGILAYVKQISLESNESLC